MANECNQRTGELVINPYNLGFLCQPSSCLLPLSNPNPSFLVRMDLHRSFTLVQFMADNGVMASPEETLKREHIIQELKKIVQSWITKVAWQRNLPDNVIRDASATVLTYGSYGLGVHNSESDIDALCVAPWFATMAEDFFVVLYNILKGKSEVSEIHCVKDAKVPLMRFKFEGVAIDLPYAQLQNVDLLNPMFLTSIDETSWRSISGVRVNQCILQLVPNLELFGFLGGIHLAILSALVCQRNPDACVSALVMCFFNTFASWPWPIPVVLQDGMVAAAHDTTEVRSWMPIRLPCSPYHYCHSNITRSTFNRIRAEFLRGQNIARDILRPDFDWIALFEPYGNMYRKLYSRFLKIYLLADVKDELGDWIGWVKSRFPSLILKLEEIRVSCDPNPTEYVDTSNAVNSMPSVVFYWGLNLGRSVDFNVYTLERDFWNNLRNGYRGIPGKIELSIVPSSELPSIAELPARESRRMEACWRFPDYDDQRMPVYSRHLPNYIVGYLANGGNHASFGV
ncbi:Nuclear poly(A) polymerase 3 [Bienertia sinuspersici]